MSAPVSLGLIGVLDVLVGEGDLGTGGLGLGLYNIFLSHNLNLM